MRALFVPVLAATLAWGWAAQAEDTLTPLHFQSQGAMGTIDKAAAQRGYQVYTSVCAGCHGMSQVHYRDLEALGLTPDQAAAEALAASATLDSPLKGAAPMSMGGAVPPDLSSIAAQRAGGTRYLYHLLTGYDQAPEGVTLLQGHYYNTAFPGGQLAMPPVLRDNAVSYADGTPASVVQEAADVAEFLTFAADPNLDSRHQIGFRALIFFGLLSILAIAAKRNVWRPRL